MKVITATEIMEQIQLLSESPANSKNERAFCLRDIRDCAVRLLDGEAVPAVKESLTTETKEPTTDELNPLDVSSWDCCDEHETNKYAIAFWNAENVKVGVLDLDAIPISFVGDVDESAKLFFTLIEDMVAMRVAELESTIKNIQELPRYQINLADGYGKTIDGMPDLFLAADVEALLNRSNNDAV